MLGNQRYLILFLSIFPRLIFAETIEFEDFWKAVEIHSFSQKAKVLEVKASEIAKNRSDRHWLPRIYTDVRAYNTNDPALNLLGKLGQRSATDADFSTSSARTRVGNFLDSNNQPYNTLNSDTANMFAKDTLNHPGSNTYSRGSLGLDFSIYEGGASQAMSKLQEKRALGLKFEKANIKDQEYIQSARFYRGLQSLTEFRERIINLNKTESKFQSGYQLANKNNPVGYTGYLALKSLKNRLLAMEKETDAQVFEFKESLSLLSGLETTNIKTKNIDLFEFLNLHFPKPIAQEESSYTKAMTAYAEGENLKSDLEMAKFLPKVGVYSEANAYSGSRSTQAAYNAGFYVQMNLYSPKEQGSVEEAKLQAEAYRTKLDEAREREISTFNNLKTREVTLFENYQLIKESIKNQEEQVIYMQRLFQSGAISAIQFAEVLNRSADLAKSLLDTELNYLQIRSEFHKFQNGKTYESESTN